MENLNKQERVDELIQQFWKNGYLTLSRKYGTFLPDPPKIGEYDIDALGKYKNQYAIGITLSEDEINSPSINDKIEYLASRHNRFSHKNVILFLSVPGTCQLKMKKIIAALNNDIRKNIRLTTLPKATIN